MTIVRLLTLLIASATASLVAAKGALAQCPWELQSAGGYPGANAFVHACISWDPDGVGPAPERAVFGGEFTVIGTAAANRIATYDPATNHWTSLGVWATGSEPRAIPSLA